MSNTLNRPMFKRGPDGQMRQAKWIGGIMRALPYAYRGAKYLAPKFTNVPHNIKRMRFHLLKESHHHQLLIGELNLGRINLMHLKINMD